MADGTERAAKRVRMSEQERPSNGIEYDARTCPSTSRRVNAPRKRSVYACNFCRVRKVKCDNEKPACGFCVRHGVQCVYAEDNVEAKHLFDPASLEIMRAIEEVRRMVEDGNGKVEAKLDALSRGPRTVEASATFHENGDLERSVDEEQHKGLYETSVHFQTSGEAMLRWPIFKDVLTDEHRRIESFLLDSDVDLDTTQTGNPHSTGKHEMRHHEIAHFCRRYIMDIHPRNPVLDDDALLRYADEVAEQGLGWDTKSCLVV